MKGKGIPLAVDEFLKVHEQFIDRWSREHPETPAHPWTANDAEKIVEQFARAVRLLGWTEALNADDAALASRINDVMDEYRRILMEGLTDDSSS